MRIAVKVIKIWVPFLKIQCQVLPSQPDLLIPAVTDSDDDEEVGLRRCNNRLLIDFLQLSWFRLFHEE